MKHKWLLISLSVCFFLTALTFYANRILFPNVLKKIATEQAQSFLKRKVEIESLHFNWFKGVIIDHIKVYQKDSSTEILAQAETISFGVIFIPGFKHHQLIIPSINIQSPSFQLIHQADGQWNFSDLLIPSAPNTDEKPSPVSLSVGGVVIVDGKLRLDAIGPSGLWTELFNAINVKAGLSYQGIQVDGSINIPQKQGFLSIKGAYQPLDRSFKADVNLKNIKPLDYLGLLPIQLPFTLNSGTINNVHAHVNYSTDNIGIQGDWSIKNIDAILNGQTIKTDMDVSDADIVLNKDGRSIKGNFTLTNTKILTPDLSVTGNFKAAVDRFVMKAIDDIVLKASIQTNEINVQFQERSFQGQIKAQIDQGRLQKNSLSIDDGYLDLTHAFIALNDQQGIKGDFLLKNIKIIKERSSTNANMDLKINTLDLRLPGEVFKGNLNAPHLTISLDDHNNFKAHSNLDLTDLDVMSKDVDLKGNFHLKDLKASFDQKEQILDVQTQGTLENALIALSNKATLKATAHFQGHVLYPLKNPDQLDYQGSVAVEDAQLDGLPMGPLSRLNATADIQTDKAVIQNLSLTVLDTPIKASGSVTHFSKPVLNMNIESQRFDLSKIKDVAPDILKPYGLTVDGETSIKMNFQGLAADPLSAQIHALAILKNVNVQSSSLKQNFKNISGTIKAEGDSLSWENFTATILDHPLTSNGDLTNFKNPRINTSLSWQGIKLTAKIAKNDQMVNIQDLFGRYLAVPFHAVGSIYLSGKTPQLDIQGDLKIKVEELGTIVPSLQKSLEPLKASGSISLQTSVTGPVSDWKNLKADTTLTCDLLKMKDLKFNNVKALIKLADGQIKNSTLESDLYSGHVNVISSVDLTDKTLPADIAVKVENVDVSAVMKDLKVVQDIRGQFNLTSTLKASLIKPLEVRGKGNTSIKEAYLADIELFKGILTPLRTIIPSSNLILNEVDGSFDVADQKVTTNDLQFKGNIMNLVSKGSLAFDQTINMSIEAPDEYNQQSPLPSEIRKSIHFTVTGKVSKPKVEHNFTEVKTIINIGKTILGDKLPQGISDIINQLPF